MKWFKKKNNFPTFDPPGPSPWYLHKKIIETPSGIYRWNNFEIDHKLAGVSFLTNPSGKKVLYLKFHCYVQYLKQELILLWYERTPEVDKFIGNPLVQFEILDLSKLTGIEEADVTAHKMREENPKVKYAGEPKAQFVYYTSVDQGEHTLEKLPSDFAELDEVLVLADYAKEGKSSNYYDYMCRAIFAFDFKAANVLVIPQDWFNNGRYDFGYQWITRVCREPKTKKIFGEGIRLGFFRLDETGRNIEKWIISDTFYHPK